MKYVILLVSVILYELLKILNVTFFDLGKRMYVYR